MQEKIIKGNHSTLERRSLEEENLPLIKPFIISLKYVFQCLLRF